MRTTVRAALCAALLMVSGCAAEAAAPETAAQTGEPWFDETAAATKAGDIAACKGPVTFDIAAKWEPEPIELDGSAFDELLTQGDATVVCEVDGKPADEISYLRVYTAKTEPRAALEAFLAGDDGVSGIVYRDRPSGAIEATFMRKTELDPDGKRGYATVVKTSAGAAVLTMGGFGSEDTFAEYVLARDSLKATG